MGNSCCANLAGGAGVSSSGLSTTDVSEAESAAEVADPARMERELKPYMPYVESLLRFYAQHNKKRYKVEMDARRNPNRKGGVRHIVDYYIRRGGNKREPGNGLQQLNALLNARYDDVLDIDPNELWVEGTKDQDTSDTESGDGSGGGDGGGGNGGGRSASPHGASPHDGGGGGGGAAAPNSEEEVTLERPTLKKSRTRNIADDPERWRAMVRSYLEARVALSQVLPSIEAQGLGLLTIVRAMRVVCTRRWTSAARRRWPSPSTSSISCLPGRPCPRCARASPAGSTAT